jgi:hypothetical protein
VILLLSLSPALAYRSFDTPAKSVSLTVFPSSQFKSYSYGIHYAKNDLEYYLTTHKTSNLYLFGIYRKYQLLPWFALTAGISGQKAREDMPFGLILGNIIGWKAWGIDFSVPLITSFYRESAMTVEYGAHLDYRRLLLGMRGLMWYEPGEGNVNELYWVVGVKYKL